MPWHIPIAEESTREKLVASDLFFEGDVRASTETTADHPMMITRETLFSLVKDVGRCIPFP